jgi:hypothetical protein
MISPDHLGWGVLLEIVWLRVEHGREGLGRRSVLFTRDHKKKEPPAWKRWEV